MMECKKAKTSTDQTECKIQYIIVTTGLYTCKYTGLPYLLTSADEVRDQ